MVLSQSIKSSYLPKPSGNRLLEKKKERKTHLQLRHPILQDTVQTDVVLPRTIYQMTGLNSLSQEVVTAEPLDLSLIHI